MSHDDNMEQIEKAKYEKVWADPAYRGWSPGCEEQQRANKFFEYLAQEVPETPTVADYGCGEGITVQYFSDLGYKAFGVDHAKNAVSAAGILTFEACLWDMMHLPDTHFAFCCDVMEHIPHNKVNLVLSNIAQRTSRMAYFRIATVPDNFGPKLLGEPLHLTVEDAAWWTLAMQRHWEEVKLIERRWGYCVIICAEPKIFRTDAQESTPTESA